MVPCAASVIVIVVVVVLVAVEVVVVVVGLVAVVAVKGTRRSLTLVCEKLIWNAPT